MCREVVTIIRSYGSFHIDSFQPYRGLQNGHLQTIVPALFLHPPPIEYTRQRVQTPDGDFIDLDWNYGDPQAPIVLALHGLEGCSRSGYILRLMRPPCCTLEWLCAGFRGAAGNRICCCVPIIPVIQVIWIM